MNDYSDSSVENMDDYINSVAVIGMAGRFPGAQNIDEFWRNIRDGVDCIAFYNDGELTAAGIDPEVLKHPDYVRAKGEAADVDMFDAQFFGVNPREAEVTDPQHRMLLECAWEAMEHAGYDSSKYDGLIGVYAGKSMDYYLLLNVYPRIKREISAGSLQAAIGNDKDSLTTLISYRMNLTGPAITIQTSSSTSLVAVCVACQSLLTYQCDIALAGGITAGPPIRCGYLYQEGNIWSRDGHCRAFDARAQGFVPGTGMGLVVLRRLEDAINDGDHIWAIIKGFAVNNDGSNKVSYTAPSVDAQAEVVQAAQASAGVHPETIQYVETHGTGTHLGDPIEMTALTRAFRARSDKRQYCAIGSVKSNIGHLDNAAGVTGLIKAALALKYRQIPPTLHYENANTEIDFENSPFFVNTKLREWPANGTPRRAGVTSLGMGGTNAHVILQEAPTLEKTGKLETRAAQAQQGEDAQDYRLLLLSARTETALENMTRNLKEYIGHASLNLTDAAYTLARGRRDFNNRRAVLCRDAAEAQTHLEALTPGRVFDALCDTADRAVVFMFPGQGAQYVNMGKGLYLEEPIFKENIDKCAEILLPILGLDIRELVFPAKKEDIEKNAAKLQETRLTQPILFVFEYSLAQLFSAWGIKPQGMIGHSIGEYAAACIAGCMSLADALTLVAARGRLMFEQEKGAMLSVGLTEPELEKELALIPGSELAAAAINSPKHCVVSGKEDAIEKLEKQLAQKNIFCKQLRTSHAFHSIMMEPIMDEFAELLGKVKLQPPKIPFISCVSGTWIQDKEACSPRYWAEQLRRPVRFSDGIREILTEASPVLLEIGPGNSLGLLAKEHKHGKAEAAPTILSSIRHIKQTEADTLFILKTLAQLWLTGVSIDWEYYYKHLKQANCRRTPLPTYPFERKRYWLEEMKEKTTPAFLEMEKEEISPQQEAALEEKKREKEPPAKAFQPRPALAGEYAAPTDEIETNLVAIWEDILGIQPIGINDNFFDLGGHSLLATLFLSRLQEQFHIRLEMRTIFEEPTVACVARQVKIEYGKESDYLKIEALLNEVEEDLFTLLEPAKELENYPLSSAQQRFYMLQYMDQTSTSYNMTGIMMMDGKLDKKRFDESFKKLIARHETLRTSFKMVGEAPRQEIHPVGAVEFAVEYHECLPDAAAGETPDSHKAGTHRQTVGNRLAQETAETIPQHLRKIIQDFIRPFDLTRPPLLRIALIRMAEEKQVLMFDMHHIISDGASLNLVVKDFTGFYAGKDPAPLKLQYKDYCEWQNRLLTTGKLQKQEEYWLNHFSGKLPVLKMPTDYPRPDFQSSAGERIAFFFDEAQTREIHRLMRETGTTLFMVISAFYNTLLHKYTRQEDIIIGLPIAGRGHKDLENIIGLSMETLAIRNFPAAEKPFDKFLEEVRQNALDAFENQLYPFRELVKRVVNENDLSRNPLFDAMLIVQNIPGNLEEIAVADLRLTPYQDTAPAPVFVDICLEVEEKENKIFFNLKYCVELFKRETMEQFIAVFREIASSAANDPKIKLKDIKISHNLIQAESTAYKKDDADFEF